jgi:hypothetical protein
MAVEITKPIEISPSEIPAGLQEEMATTEGVFKSELDKLEEPLSFKELEELGTKSVETARSNKLDIISDTVGEPVTNADFKFNLKDMALNFDLSRSRSFVNRRDKFLSYYPEGEFIRNQVTVGNKTLDLEMYKYDKNDKGYKLVEPFGLEASDFAELMGTIVDEQLLGEGLALVGMTSGAPLADNLKKGDPKSKKSLKGKILDRISRLRIRGVPIGNAARIFLGSYLGVKTKDTVEALRGYGEGDFTDEINFKDYFTEKDDYFTAALSSGFYGVTKFAGDVIFKGKRPGTIEITPELVAAAERLGMKPLIFAQLAVNPQIRNIYTQAEGFTSFVKDTEKKQIDSIINSFQSGKNPFKDLKIREDLNIDMQDLINVQTTLANDIKKGLKINFNIKDGNIDMAAADKALAQSVTNYNLIANKAINNFTTKATNSAVKSGDYVININGFKNVFTREINKLKSNVTTKDVIEKGKKKGEFVEAPYKTTPKDFVKIEETLNTINRTINSVNDPKLLNLKTLYKVRDDLYNIMYDPNAKSEIIAAATNMHKNLDRLLDPKNGLIKGDAVFIHNIDLLNSQVRNSEIINGMNKIRQALVAGDDIDGFVKTMIKPNNTHNILAIKEMFRLPENASNAEKIANEKLFNTIKNYWITSTIKSKNGDKILNDFLINDKKSLEVLLGPNYETKVAELLELSKTSKRLEDGIAAQALSNKATSTEFINGIIKNATKGDFGTNVSVKGMIDEFGGINSKLVNDIRNNILKDIFKRSSKIEEKGGKKLFTEVLDVKKFADNIKKLRENENLTEFFTDDQIQALLTYEQYSRAVGGNLGVGGELAKAEQTAQLVQKFNIIDTGLTILKYDVLARILSSPVTAKQLIKLTPDGYNSANIAVLQTALVRLEEELFEKATGENQINDTGVITKPVEIVPDKDVKVVPTEQPIEVPSGNVNQPVNVSRLGQTNVTPPLDLAAINPNTMERGRQLFNRPGEITFASKGGIMNARKIMQRVI